MKASVASTGEFQAFFVHCQGGLSQNLWRKKPELSASWCSISRSVRTNALVNRGGFPLPAAIYWSRSSLRIPADHYAINWRPSTMIRTYLHPVACCFLFLLLPVLGTIFKCASRAIFWVATLAASRWTNCCQRCCCVHSSDAVYEEPVVSLDSDLLSLSSGICLAMNCWCGKGEEDDNQKKWEVLRNI